MPIERLFSEIDNTEHVYTWDYTEQKRAHALYDVDKDRFALITYSRSIADETGAMGDYRDISGFCGYLFSKSNPRLNESICEDESKIITCYTKESSLIELIRLKTRSIDIIKVGEITLESGRVYISEGNLLLDRG